MAKGTRWGAGDQSRVLEGWRLDYERLREQHQDLQREHEELKLDYRHVLQQLWSRNAREGRRVGP